MRLTQSFQFQGETSDVLDMQSYCRVLLGPRAEAPRFVRDEISHNWETHINVEIYSQTA